MLPMIRNGGKGRVHSAFCCAALCCCAKTVAATARQITVTLRSMDAPRCGGIVTRGDDSEPWALFVTSGADVVRSKDHATQGFPAHPARLLRCRRTHGCQRRRMPEHEGLAETGARAGQSAGERAG